ncbi:TetR/AcrR family transcriptional regulator [Mycobacterium sp. M1]|uniref:TetR/AcrR family transcriptional regulator n=1 Tax=Mycolicibacter acidiphilus TaxID=2835306 RepID=A0ABS5RH08_9MYCO|nr:TetR/AcrR family transcriptional regulator [Mycolicibacter acidiphilus]MBS9533459.1 TetR/AcrR family transcriptional regulator [Mycolicibacter acidiphilus]
MTASAPGDEDENANRRSRLKSDRRTQLLTAAERLFAERGFLGVRLEDIGAAAGVSGPAIYRHFSGKEALLVELLVGISTRLLTGARDVDSRQLGPLDTLNALIDFHLDFTLGEPDLIRIQDRDLAQLPPAAHRQVRSAQRQYVEIWVTVLRRVHPDLAEPDARLMAHAVFGLLNSTPHGLKRTGPLPAGVTQSRTVLRAMTVAALGAAGASAG